MNKIISFLPGLLVCIVIALVSNLLHQMWPPAGAAVIAMFIGMIIRGLRPLNQSWKPGMTFVSKKLLKFAIILLGGSLNWMQLKSAGLASFQVMVFTLLSAFIAAWLVGKYLMGISFNQRNLIAVGTGICGGSAIAALSPILEADDEDIAFAISATFLFDIVGVIAFPILGHLLHLSDNGYGLWVGTAVNDTSSVVAAGYAFSQDAGNFAAIVKMARTTMLLPIGLILNGVVIYRHRRAHITRGESPQFKPLKMVPWFVLIFCAVVVLNSYFPFPQYLSVGMKKSSAFIISMALAAIGLNTDLSSLLGAGRKSMILGGIVSLIVVIVSIAIQYLLGLI